MSLHGGLLALLFLFSHATARAEGSCPIDPELPLAGIAEGSDLGFAVAVPGFETDPVWGPRSVFVHLPGGVPAGEPRPLLVALHGAAGSSGAAVVQAGRARDLWREAADRGGFFVLAPAASGTSGGWIAPVNPDDHPSDYDRILAAIERVQRDYPIDPERIYLWGFSAGGHVAIDIALNRPHAQLNSGRFAAFAVNAGVSAGLACSGLGSGECATLVFTDADSKRPIAVTIGNSDPLLAFALDDRARWQSSGWRETETFFWQVFEGGHTVLPEQPIAEWNQLCAFSTRPGTKLPQRAPNIDITLRNQARIIGCAERSEAQQALPMSIGCAERSEAQ
ncbi:MAG: PHB depolymerase family esterase, partial [Lysobacterales bacterium]